MGYPIASLAGLLDLFAGCFRTAVARLAPAGAAWRVVDDTRCHKRGANVAFGGFDLDAVLSTKEQKRLRFGLSWIVSGIAVHLPFRKDRYFCLPVL